MEPFETGWDKKMLDAVQMPNYRYIVEDLENNRFEMPPRLLLSTSSVRLPKEFPRESIVSIGSLISFAVKEIAGKINTEMNGNTKSLSSPLSIQNNRLNNMPISDSVLKQIKDSQHLGGRNWISLAAEAPFPIASSRQDVDHTSSPIDSHIAGKLTVEQIIQGLDQSDNYWWFILKNSSRARAEFARRSRVLIEEVKLVDSVIAALEKQGVELIELAIVGDYLVRRNKGIAEDIDALGVGMNLGRDRRNFRVIIKEIPPVAVDMMDKGYLETGSSDYKFGSYKWGDTFIATGAVRVFSKQQTFSKDGVSVQDMLNRAEELIGAGHKELSLAEDIGEDIRIIGKHAFELYRRINS